jgi:hypothetical protein
MARYLYWRAWFLPGGGASPVLDRLTLGFGRTVFQVDDWTMAAQASISVSEYVYGTRSIQHKNDRNLLVQTKTTPVIPLRAGRSYILTGLMKSQGRSNASIYLADLGNRGFACVDAQGNQVRTEVLTETRDWFTPDRQDTYRYATQVYVAPSDMEVQVVLSSTGAAGTMAWFDAIKLEESTVATPWSPAAIGSSVLDAGGVQIDGSKGGVFRYRGRNGGTRDIVEGGAHGLVFGGDTEIASPAPGEITVNGAPIGGAARWG